MTGAQVHRRPDPEIDGRENKTVDLLAPAEANLEAV